MQWTYVAMEKNFFFSSSYSSAFVDLSFLRAPLIIRRLIVPYTSTVLEAYAY